jgi:hypothetical protein
VPNVTDNGSPKHWNPKSRLHAHGRRTEQSAFFSAFPMCLAALFFSFFQCRYFGDTCASRCADQLATAWPLPLLIRTSLGFRGGYSGDGGSNGDQSYWRNVILPVDVFGEETSLPIASLARRPPNTSYIWRWWHITSQFSEKKIANS